LDIGNIFPNALEHPGLGFLIAGRLALEQRPADAFSSRREDDLRSAGSDGGVPSLAFVLGHGLPPIGFVTLPNSAAHEIRRYVCLKAYPA